MVDEEVLTLGMVVNDSKLAERTRYQLTRRRQFSEFNVGNSWCFRFRGVGERIETQKASVWRDGERQ